MKQTGGETFLVQIRSTQNDTWQGTVTWTNGRRQESFRSALELIRLIDSAIGVNEDRREEGAALLLGEKAPV